MRSIICKYISLVCILVAFVRTGQVTNNLRVSVERVTEPYGLSEGPHWDQRSQKLYFVDIYNQYVRRLDPATGVVTNAHIESGPVGVVVPVHGLPDKLAVGVGKNVALITWDGEQNKEEVPIEILCSVDKTLKTRINDGKVDTSGRFWLGTMSEDNQKIGSLYRIDVQSKSCIPKMEICNVTISNGLTWNTKDNTFYYIDSPTRQVAAYDYEPHSGDISNGRIIFDLDNTEFTGVPDGMTIDTDGNLWIALFGGSHVINVDPKTGKVIREVKIPVKNVSSVAFGGLLRDVLYVTTSGYDLTAEERKAYPDAGAVFAVKGLGVCGNLANMVQMK